MLFLVILSVLGVANAAWPSFSQLEDNYPSYPYLFGVFGTTWDELVEEEGLDSWLLGVADKNTCTMRVSRALTHAGKTIAPGSCNWSGVRDSQNRPYIIRVGTMRCYLENEYRHADVTGSSESSFRGKKGIIVFQDCGFQAATGHVDLYDGSGCVGQCPGYFDACSNIRLFQFN
ncbi:Hypp7099 [Branchiostoma lanceolatum]|uniref:Hypp7099 protein n=1 Tax=Branchiostoma lanceolatum TaxID=7740 RepID=A0A8K0E6M4_BRALA|nr:Hypp7099 [Branchiostoma lanceolatum]